MGPYDLNDTVKIKLFLDDYMTSAEPNHEEFQYYHLNRNYFNYYTSLQMTLNQIGHSNQYQSEGHGIWTELAGHLNFFHMPLGHDVLSISGITKPWSRKFVRDDNDTGIGGEYELIVKNKALLNPDSEKYGKYQATYNFGRTANTSRHYKLDVEPHKWVLGSTQYVTHKHITGEIIINDN